MVELPKPAGASQIGNKIDVLHAHGPLYCVWFNDRRVGYTRPEQPEAIKFLPYATSQVVMDDHDRDECRRAAAEQLTKD